MYKIKMISFNPTSCVFHYLFLDFFKSLSVFCQFYYSLVINIIDECFIQNWCFPLFLNNLASKNLCTSFLKNNLPLKNFYPLY